MLRKSLKAGAVLFGLAVAAWSPGSPCGPSG